MRVAISARGERISPVFDSAAQILLVDLDSGQERSRCVALMPGNSLSARVARLQEVAVTVLICGGISQPFQRMIEAGGIRVYPWMAGDVEEVLEAYRQGRLHEARWLMPGCGNSQRSTRRVELFRDPKPVPSGRLRGGRKGKPDTLR